MKPNQLTSSIKEPSVLQQWLQHLPLLLFVGFISFVYFHRQMPHAPKSVNPASLQFVGLNGQPLPAALFEKKAMIVNFWAPWCGPCRIETPSLQKLQREHPGDLVVIGVVADASQYEQAGEFMKSRGVSYPLVRETPLMDAVFGAVSVLPTTFYITADGKVVHAGSGLLPEILMQHYLSEALKK